MRIAARVGQLVAYIFIAVGLFGVITRGDLSGLWITFVGWFMLVATEATIAQVKPARLMPVESRDSDFLP